MVVTVLAEAALQQEHQTVQEDVELQLGSAKVLESLKEKHLECGQQHQAKQPWMALSSQEILGLHQLAAVTPLQEEATCLALLKGGCWRQQLASWWAAPHPVWQWAVCS